MLTYDLFECFGIKEEACPGGRAPESVFFSHFGAKNNKNAHNEQLTLLHHILRLFQSVVEV